LVLNAVHVDANVNGGIVNLTGGAATLVNSTVNGNSGIGFENGRGDLAVGGTVTLINTSLDGNASEGILVATGSLVLIGGHTTAAAASTT
jgi:hypothetical protein